MLTTFVLAVTVFSGAIFTSVMAETRIAKKLVTLKILEALTPQEQAAKKIAHLRKYDDSPLRYGELVELRGRDINKSSNPETWRTIWTDTNSVWQKRGFYDSLILRSSPNWLGAVDRGGSLFVIKKSGEPHYRGPILAGDAIELFAMYGATVTKRHGEDNFGLGRKLWAFHDGSHFYGHGFVVVGPNDDPRGMARKGGLPRPELGAEKFIIEGDETKSPGSPIKREDIVRFKTPESSPFVSEGYLWTFERGGNHAPLLIGGKGNTFDERSHSLRNQFNVRPALFHKENSDAYTSALEMLQLSEGSIIALQDSRGKYLVPAEVAGKEHDQLRKNLKTDTFRMLVASDDLDASSEETHFVVHVQKGEWIGFESLKKNLFLQAIKFKGKHLPILVEKNFEDQRAFEQHWAIDGTLDAAYLMNQSFHLHLATKESNETHLMKPSKRHALLREKRVDDRFTIKIIELAPQEGALPSVHREMHHQARARHRKGQHKRKRARKKQKNDDQVTDEEPVETVTTVE